MNTVHIPEGQSIDRYLKMFREPGTVFQLEAGHYTTQGCFAFPEHDLCMLAPECSIVGAGRDRTVIMVMDPVLTHEGKRTQYFEALTGGAANYGNSLSMRLEGFTLNAGLRECPKIGIHLWTSRATVRDVFVMEAWGYRDHPGDVKEGFGILINNSRFKSPNGTEVDGGHIVENCQVQLASSEKENYVTAFFVGCEKRDVPLLQSTIRNCQAYSVDAPGHAAFASGDSTDILGCECHGFVRAYFLDTGCARRVRIRDMIAHDVQWAVDVRVGVPGHVRREFVVSESAFYFTPHQGAWVQALRAEDQANPLGTSIEDIRFTGCRFDAQACSQASKGRCNGPRVGEVVAQFCEWVGDWQEPVLQGGAKEWRVL